MRLAKTEENFSSVIFQELGQAQRKENIKEVVYTGHMLKQYNIHIK